MSALPNATFSIPGAWRPAQSLLGRWIRAHSVDDRQAESTFVVVVVIAAIGLALIHILLWTLLKPAWGGDSFWTLVAAEAFVGGAVAATALGGWAPAITVRAGRAGLIFAIGNAATNGRTESSTSTNDLEAVRRTSEVGRDGSRLCIPYGAIDAVARVDARTFHRHYRRYAETLVFVNRIEDELLLLKWSSVPVVIGLSPADLAALERILTARTSVESSHVDAA